MTRVSAATLLEKGRRLLMRGDSAESGAIDPNAVAIILDGLDLEFYRAQAEVDLPDVRAAAAHYLRAGASKGLDPSPHFSSVGYLEDYPDVANAGVNPFVHFLGTGEGEGRVARPSLNSIGLGLTDFARSYREMQAMTAARAPATGAKAKKPAGFVELLKGDARTDLDRIRREVDAAATRMDLGALRRGAQNPDVSIIILNLSQPLLTLECLVSIERHADAEVSVEVVLVDNASIDPVSARLAEIPGLVFLAQDENLGFGPGCNAGAAEAAGAHLLMLNNDAQIAKGALSALLERVQAEGASGPVAVAPKILFPDGRLQEAGAHLNPDGTGHLIGHGEDPGEPRFNYARRVQHASAAAYLMRRADFETLGGFDPVFAPAYCEDADLSLRIADAGGAVFYEPAAVVIHHMSATTNSGDGGEKLAMAARNRRTLIERWGETLLETDLRAVALYLPQFHPIPENDLWWGRGFTEWTNVHKAQPNYKGHKQPRIPADLGFYDLRLPDAIRAQAALAKRYGVHGFCFYYYSFNGRRVLDAPMRILLETPDIDLPFCACWANENWTRTWDGLEKDVLLHQDYSEASLRAVIEDMIPYMKDPRYIRVRGRPIFLIYRIGLLPDPKAIVEMWRQIARDAGVGEICMAIVESFELSPKPVDPSVHGCDLSVEFPAHGLAGRTKLAVEKTNPDFDGEVRDYRELAVNVMTRREAGFPRIRNVVCGWDNTPRRQNASLVMEHADPGSFQAWLEWTFRRTIEQNPPDERLVFLTAWNEWCEGCYLEPDGHFGHGYLRAVANAHEKMIGARFGG